MNFKLETFLICIGGIIRIVTIVADVWYLITQSFSPSFLYWVFIGSLIAPSVVLLVIYVLILISDWCKGQGFSCFKFLMFLLFIIGDTIGLTYFVFTLVLCFTPLKSGDLFIIDALLRGSSLVNSLFMSAPQIVIQIYNNQQVNNWGVLTILSVGVSAASMFYTCTKLVYAIDKVTQYEQVTKSKIQDNIKPGSTETNEVRIEKEAHHSVYDST